MNDRPPPPVVTAPDPGMKNRGGKGADPVSAPFFISGTIYCSKYLLNSMRLTLIA